ncbi:hypothetical protein CWATWH0402_227 [Crocosphaera watsonii WH 0402]|uniref:Uncharacterized protein n=2 Tax=Crocosphaera watsonii TaxID=263511 RepID=T2JWH1_CROWT|nr:hypothetical protein CWATWH0005_2893 [Crocosphaera watsonii WH 0005]CCQ70168.1 hypothetical protein CWATWH0402_227 [Crocosphaera watsonii WH 0402]
MGNKQQLNPKFNLDLARCKLEKIRILLRISIGEKILIRLKKHLKTRKFTT